MFTCVKFQKSFFERVPQGMGALFSLNQYPYIQALRKKNEESSQDSEVILVVRGMDDSLTLSSGVKSKKGSRQARSISQGS